MKIQELARLYEAHCDRRGDDALALDSFMYRINDSKRIRTEDEIINKPPKGWLKERYKQHVEKHGDNAVRLHTFRRRIVKHGRDEQRAIDTPSQRNNRELKMSLKKIWKRLKGDGLFNKSYSMFTVCIEKGRIDLLEVATVDEISQLHLYKGYRQKGY